MRRRLRSRTVHRVATSDRPAGLYPALLKHWRRRSGLSQLDLALAADVSARHVSFLETGRSVPSAEMVVRLATTLGVPLRHVDAMLDAAGHAPIYGERGATMSPAVRGAIDLMKRHHEPFPMVVVDRSYRVVDLNTGALAVLGNVLGNAPGHTGAPTGGLNLARLTFDPDGAQPFIVNFDEVGRQLLWRLQREVLAEPDEHELRELLDDVLSLPTVDEAWRDVDLAAPSDPVLVLHLRRDDVELRFLTMITVFQAPQNVDVEQLMIETWFPYDDATADRCRAWAAASDPRAARAD